MYWDSSSIIPLKRKSQHLRRDIFGGFSSLWSFFSHTNTPLCCVTWAFCQKCHQWSVADTLTSSLIRHLRICPRSAMLSVWRNSMLLGVRIFVYFLYIKFDLYSCLDPIKVDLIYQLIVINCLRKLLFLPRKAYFLFPYNAKTQEASNFD